MSKNSLPPNREYRIPPAPAPPTCGKRNYWTKAEALAAGRETARGQPVVVKAYKCDTCRHDSLSPRYQAPSTRPIWHWTRSLEAFAVRRRRAMRKRGR